MKTFPIFLFAALCFVEPVLAEPAQKVVTVDTTGINLSTQTGVDALTSRMLNQMHDEFCGRRGDTFQGQATSLGNYGERRANYRACIASLSLPGEQPQVVQDAFLTAVAKMKGPN